MKNATIVATAVLGLFATSGCSSDGGDPDTTSQELVQCQGINDCAGMTECATEAGNSCEGMNECAGQGWLTVPRTDCEEQEGTVVGS